LNKLAVSADTSSWAAATRPVVGPAKAALAAVISDSICAVSAAAVASNWGSAIMLVIEHSLSAGLLS